MVASAILFLAEKDTTQGAQRVLRFIGDIVWGIVLLLLKGDISSLIKCAVAPASSTPFL